MLKLKIYYKNGSKSKVCILKHKDSNTYSYVNLTKGHICPCVFNSVEEALKDLENYKNILKVKVILPIRIKNNVKTF